VRVGDVQTERTERQTDLVVTLPLNKLDTQTKANSSAINNNSDNNKN